MKVYRPDSRRLEDVCGDFDVAIFLSEEEAVELRLALETKNEYTGPFKDAPFQDKLYLALEMISVGVETE